MLLATRLECESTFGSVLTDLPRRYCTLKDVNGRLAQSFPAGLQLTNRQLQECRVRSIADPEFENPHGRRINHAVTSRSSRSTTSTLYGGSGI